MNQNNVYLTLQEGDIVSFEYLVGDITKKVNKAICLFKRGNKTAGFLFFVGDFRVVLKVFLNSDRLRNFSITRKNHLYVIRKMYYLLSGDSSKARKMMRL